MRELTSATNPLLKRLRAAARDAAAYRRSGELWLEGEHLVEAWLAAGRPIRQVVVARSRLDLPLTRQAVQQAEDALCVPDALFASISSLETPAGLAVVVPVQTAQAIKPFAPTVVLDSLQDPGNVGTVLRTAAALGFEQILALKGTVALWSPKVLRAGMGAHLALHLVEALDELSLQSLSLPLVATLPTAPSAIWQTRLPWPLAWVLGHEGQGVSEAVQARCSLSVRIPQPGGQESLNAAVAAAICMYESARQRLTGV